MFFNNSGNSCWDRISYLQSLSFTHFLWNLSLKFRAFLSLLIPAGCSSTSIEESLPPAIDYKVPVMLSDIRNGNTHLDILVFENDRLARLDAYQRIDEFNGNIAYIESTGGKKILFLYAGGPHYHFEWSHVNSYGCLKEMRTQLKHESIGQPTLSGECEIDAGGRSGQISLKPLISEVRIEAISCDFSNTPYAGSQIT